MVSLIFEALACTSVTVALADKRLLSDMLIMLGASLTSSTATEISLIWIFPTSSVMTKVISKLSFDS